MSRNARGIRLTSHLLHRLLKAAEEGGRPIGLGLTLVRSSTLLAAFQILGYVWSRIEWTARSATCLSGRSHASRRVGAPNRSGPSAFSFSVRTGPCSPDCVCYLLYSSAACSLNGHDSSGASLRVLTQALSQFDTFPQHFAAPCRYIWAPSLPPPQSRRIRWQRKKTKEIWRVQWQRKQKHSRVGLASSAPFPTSSSGGWAQSTQYLRPLYPAGRSDPPPLPFRRQSSLDREGPRCFHLHAFQTFFHILRLWGARALHLAIRW